MSCKAAPNEKFRKHTIVYLKNIKNIIEIPNKKYKNVMKGSLTWKISENRTKVQIKNIKINMLYLPKTKLIHIRRSQIDKSESRL